MKDKFLLVAHGATVELTKAKTVLRITQPDELDLRFTGENIPVRP